MNIKFIGTGSGLTLLHRFHSSFLIGSSNYKLLVDCGDGTARALLNQNINFNEIDGILISHFHSDHYTGLPSLITQMKLTKRENPLSIFVHSSKKDFLDEFIFHSYLFKERMKFDFQIIPFKEEDEITLSDGFKFISKINSHLDKYKKFDTESKLNFISLSFLFKDKINSCLYTGDIGSEKDLYLFNQKVDWFITEVTHISPDSLTNILQEINPAKIILTHLDDKTEEVVQNFFETDLGNAEKEHCLLAFDGLELNQST